MLRDVIGRRDSRPWGDVSETVRFRTIPVGAGRRIATLHSSRLANPRFYTLMVAKFLNFRGNVR